MGEQERPGEQELARSGRVTDDDDTEGHRIKFGSPDTEQPPSDAADTEGHATRGKLADDDTEGHGIRGRYASEGTDEPPSDEAEGHGVSSSPGRGLRISPDAETPSDDADSEGHGFRGNATPDEDAEDTEGHGRFKF
jgi:hypothetical protein